VRAARGGNSGRYGSGGGGVAEGWKKCTWIFFFFFFSLLLARFTTAAGRGQGWRLVGRIGVSQPDGHHRPQIANDILLRCRSPIGNGQGSDLADDGVRSASRLSAPAFPESVCQTRPAHRPFQRVPQQVLVLAAPSLRPPDYRPNRRDVGPCCCQIHFGAVAWQSAFSSLLLHAYILLHRLQLASSPSNLSRHSTTLPPNFPSPAYIQVNRHIPGLRPLALHLPLPLASR